MTQRQSQVNLLTINKFAKMCRTTPRTLRLYEKKGLLKPAYIDTYNSYRYYKVSQVEDFQKIRLLKNFHVPLREIHPRIKEKKLDNFLSEKVENLNIQIEELEKESRFLQRMQVFMTTKNQMSLLKKEKIGPYKLFCWYIEEGNYYKITQYIIELQQFCRKHSIDFHPYHQITFYVDSEYNPQKAKLEIAFITKTKKNTVKNLPKNYYFKKIPKSDALTYTYQGPYEYLELIYQKLGFLFWKIRKDKSPFLLEIYKQGVLNNISKYDYITKIAVPLN